MEPSSPWATCHPPREVLQDESQRFASFVNPVQASIFIPMTNAPSGSEFINRELGQIAFNRRVLAQAENKATPFAGALEVSLHCQQQFRRVF